MPSFEHNKLIDRISSIDQVPEETSSYATWIKAGSHLSLLRENAGERELILSASGPYTFIHAAVVPNERLAPIDQNDLLGWSSNPFNGAASYVSGGGREGMWIERGVDPFHSSTLSHGHQLVFGRTFEGWVGTDRTYFEILQEYAHLAGIHWRREHQAYCRFDENGDLEFDVSITTRSDGREVDLVTFKRETLDEYLAASNSALVRMFDFTLYSPRTFPVWDPKSEEIISENENFFYRQNVVSSHAAYTRGVQILRCLRSPNEIFADISNRWTGRGSKKYVEFLAHDWRNKIIKNISTDPIATTNYFDANKNNLPYELSPAFFRPEVLSKYKVDPDKYKVGPRDIQCRAAWSLRGYDVNEAGQIHAYICYLRHLPYSEQLHWLSYNEPPKAGISERAITTDFKGEYTAIIDPLQRILYVLRRWSEEGAVWWNATDSSLFDRVSIPRTGSKLEWGEAFMNLSKLIIEGFDVSAIRSKLKSSNISFEKDDRSLVLLERLLGGQNRMADSCRLEGLRTVQLIRTKLRGHSGGRDAVDLAESALKEHQSFASHYEYVCEAVFDELNRIEGVFC